MKTKALPQFISLKNELFLLMVSPVLLGFFITLYGIVLAYMEIL